MGRSSGRDRPQRERAIAYQNGDCRATKREDAAVTANVKNAIAASIGPGAALINVETRVAVVTLSGQAATPEIRIRAREAAWIVSGVRDVIDRIDVRATA